MKTIFKHIPPKRIFAIIFAYGIPVIFGIGTILAIILLVRFSINTFKTILTLPIEQYSLKSLNPSIYGFHFSFTDFERIIGRKLKYFEMGGIWLTLAGFTYFVLVIIKIYGRQIIIGMGNIISGIFNKFISFLFGKIFRIPRFTKKQEFSSFLGIFLSYLKRYTSDKNLSFINIFRSHFFFFLWIFKLEFFPREGKQNAMLKIPFECRSFMDDLNYKLEQFVGKGVYTKGPFVFKDQYISFCLSENSLGFKDTSSRLQNNKDEILRVLPFYNHEQGSIFEVAIEMMKTDTRIMLYKKDIWKETRKMDIMNTEIPKGELLLGFYPKVTNTGIEYLDYSLKTSNMIHSFVAGTTRSGKDVFMNNFIFSILKNIKDYSNLSLYLFDTKGVDWVAFENLENHSIYKYEEKDYIKILEFLISEMNRRYKKIGIYSKLSRYLEVHPEDKNDMKETFIVINEVLDLFTRADKKYISLITSYLTELLSKGAGAGLHLVLIAQTMAKKMHPDASLLLANIKTRFGLKLGDIDQADIVGAGLSKNDLERLRRIIENNCMHIEDMKIIKEFKSFMITQEELLEFVDKTFNPIRVFENTKLNRYLTHILNTKNISLKEATDSPFMLSEKEWKIFTDHLISKKIIRYENGIGYIFECNPEEKNIQNDEIGKI